MSTMLDVVKDGDLAKKKSKGDGKSTSEIPIPTEQEWDEIQAKSGMNKKSGSISGSGSSKPKHDEAREALAEYHEDVKSGERPRSVALEMLYGHFNDYLNKLQNKVKMEYFQIFFKPFTAFLKCACNVC